MWTITKVEGEDFLSYGKLCVDLRSMQGITLIAGRRDDKPGKSNGSGKSTLFHAITWCLYDYIPKKIAADKVIRRGSNEAWVRVHVSDGGPPLIVTRKRSKRGGSLEVSGFDARALIGGQQSAINQRLGDITRFLSTAMFSGGVSSFCRRTDSERKALLEEVAGVHQYAAASDEAKRAYDAAVTEITNLERELAASTEAVERLREARSRYATSSLMHAHVVNRECRRLRDEAISAAEASDVAHSELSTWIREAHAKRKVAEAAAAAADGKIAKLEAQREAITQAILEKSKADSGFSSKLTTLGDEVLRYQDGRHPDICPTCSQRWPQDGDSEALAKKVAGLNDEILKVTRARAPIAAEIQELTQRSKDTLRDLNAARQELRAAESVVDARAYQRLLSAALVAEADLTSAQDELIRYEESHDTEPDTQEMDAVGEELRVARDRVVAIDTRLTELREERDDAAFWRKGFGRSGLPSFLVDASIPAMSEVVGDIARDLTDGELTVRFNPAAAKGAGTVFAVEVDYAEGGESFEASSHGEQTRVDMSVLFAIRDFTERQHGATCGQLFLDEVMDGADDAFVEAFLRLLRSRYGDRQTFIVSHEPSAASLCDRTLLVRKTKGVATI
jgi:DNA repair exonuclease SbcCD ATPase subunit